MVPPSPRSERARRDVLEVTADLVAEVGVEAVTIEEVAARSGVAKTTIYRHWPSKPALVLAAVGGCLAPLVTPNSGDLRTDVLACFEGIVQSGLSGRVSQMMLSVLDAAQRDEDLARLVDGWIEDRRRPLVTVLQLAQGRGDLPAELDPELGAVLLVGPLQYRKLIQRVPVDETFLVAVVDHVLAGLRSALAPT
jgi:AcrR family transcriptional regulator